MFNPSQTNNILDFKAVDIVNGLTTVTITLPEGLIRSFKNILENLYSFHLMLSRQEKIRRNSIDYSSIKEKENRKKLKDEYVKDVCETYKDFIKKGLTKDKAISMTSRKMKEEESPWSDCYSVRITLSENKMLGKQGVKKKDST